MHRYSSLGDWLLRRGSLEVTAGFDELSAVVPGGLPASAYRRATWWSNEPRHAQCLDGWDAAGYRVAQVDLSARVVTLRATGAPRWTLSDAWVFAACGGGLSDLIANGDVINHAILTEAEITRAVPRLVSAGLIDADPYLHTPAGALFFEHHMRRRGLFGWIEAIPPALRRLGPPVDGPFSLASGAYDRAVQAWHDRAQEIIQSLSRRRRP